MSDLTHAELQELLGAFALDAVEGEEYEAVELHLRECPRCRAEVADHREVAALIGHGGAPAPDGVWDRIVAAIEPAPPAMRLHVRPLEPAPAPVSVPTAEDDSVVVPIERRRRSDKWNRRLLAAAAVAAVVIVVLGSIVFRLDNRVDHLNNQFATVKLKDVAGDVLVNPDAKQIELRSSASDTVVQAALTTDGEGYLWAGNTPQLSSDRTYQLWGVVGDRTISLGTFPGKTQVVAFRVDRDVKALAITEEQKGGVVSTDHGAVYSATV